MFDRRLVIYFNWGLLVLTLILAFAGLATIYSAVTAEALDSQKMLYFKQIIWFLAGLAAMIVSFSFDYRKLEKWAGLIYGVSIILLIVVLVFGKYIGGAKRWLVIGPISVQPSELIKIALVIILANYYSKFADTQGLTLRGLINPIVWSIMPFGLIVIQPDLGTAGLLLLIAASITFFAKIEKRTLAAALIFTGFAVPLVWLFLKSYQKKRILTFLDPERDPLGAGYHIIQSKIAIGSGMFLGKGYLKGTQNALSFLPEQHTDFIFSVLAEEWGFVGAAILLFLFLLLLMWGLNIAHNCREPFGILLAVGIIALLFWEAFINMAMVMGLMPVVGVPLPLISYGGSSMIKVMIGIGLLMNISMRRFMVE
jgi:rod shape determining protein RodA